MAMQDFNEFMNEFIRTLVNQKLQEQQVQRWLNKSLQEYAAWEQHQKNVMEEAKNNQILEDYLRNAFQLLQGTAAQQPNAPYTYSQIGRQFLPEEMRGQLPTVEQPAVSNEESISAMTKLLESLKSGQLPSTEALAKVLTSYGYKPAESVYSQVEKGKREREKTAETTAIEEKKLKMREKELREKMKTAREKIRLGWEKLNFQMKKLKEGKATDKDIDSLFKNYKDVLDIYDDQIKLLENEKSALVGTPEAETEAMAIQQKIDSLIKNKERLIKKVEKATKQKEEGMGMKEELLSPAEAREYYIQGIMREKGYTREEAEKKAREIFGY